MYLTDILLRNEGPIETLDLRLPFHGNGLPKPAIFVGANGSGKTVLLATLADSLILMATPHFQDVMPQQGMGHAYFKLVGGANPRVNAPFSLSLLSFQHAGSRGCYVEKTGNLDRNSMGSSITSRFPNVSWPVTGQVKTFSGFTPQIIKAVSRASAFCFFPSSRRELPHWLNVTAVDERKDVEPRLVDAPLFENLLRKPVFIERCREENKRWILDVLFDSRTEVVRDGDQVKTAPYDNIGDRLLLSVAKDNIDRLLQSILNDGDVRVHANYRTKGSRLAVAKGSAITIPSLDNLSLGQSLLFNLFCTIARYADMYDLSKGHELGQIEGIVVIDEIDAHLHTELQFTALPKLIRLFPRIQFVITTHAPMFLLGMEKEFGADGISTFEMPNGDEISTERFSEFKTSLDYYRQTKAFEESVRARILASTKPTVILEGDTDRDYLITYLHLSGRADLLLVLNIEWAGNDVNGIAQSGGKGTLDTIAKTFRAKLGLLQTKLLLVHDCDSGKQNETLGGKLFIRGIPNNPENMKFRRGIENLLPESLARPEFYDLRVDDKYGGDIRTLNKRRLCDWVIAQSDLSLFSAFAPLLAFVEEIAKP